MQLGDQTQGARELGDDSTQPWNETFCVSTAAVRDCDWVALGGATVDSALCLPSRRGPMCQTVKVRC